VKAFGIIVVLAVLVGLLLGGQYSPANIPGSGEHGADSGRGGAHDRPQALACIQHVTRRDRKYVMGIVYDALGWPVFVCHDGTRVGERERRAWQIIETLVR